MSGMLSGLSGRGQCQLGFPPHRAHSDSQQMMPKLFLSRTSVNRSRSLGRSDMLLLQFVTDVVCLAIHGHFQRI